jgi:hypothetical protein
LRFVISEWRFLIGDSQITIRKSQIRKSGPVFSAPPRLRGELFLPIVALLRAFVSPW